MTRLARGSVATGDRLPELAVPVTRADLVRYAGASGDLNPIHWSERTAREVGLPDVIAHGMLTLALAVRLVTEWVGDPAAVTGCAARFTRPVVVPDDGAGATVQLAGSVTEMAEDGSAVVAVTARSAGQTVLGRATVIVALA